MGPFFESIQSGAPGASRYASFTDFLGVLVNFTLGVGVSLSVIFIGLAGIRFIMSNGDPKAVDQARHALMYAVLGLVLSIGALAVRTILLNTLGVSIAPEEPLPQPQFL